MLAELLQHGASDHSQDFEDKNLGSSPSLLGKKVGTIAAHPPGELPKSSSSKPIERSATPLCTYMAAHFDDASSEKGAERGQGLQRVGVLGADTKNSTQKSGFMLTK